MKNSYQAEPAVKILSEEIVNNELATDKHITQEPRANRFLILISLLALYILWGSTYLAMRIALLGFPPFLMAGVRFLIAGSILFLILRVRGKRAPTRKQWIGAALIGTLLLAGGNAGVAFSEQWVSTGLASVGIAAVPLWTALFAGSQHISLPAGLMSSSAQMLVGGAVLILLSLVIKERTPDLAISQSLWAIAYLVIFGSLLAFSAYGYLLRHTRPALATSYAYVNPMVAVGLGVVLAGERLTPMEIVAILVTLTGVGLVSLGSSRRGRSAKAICIRQPQENLASSE